MRLKNILIVVKDTERAGQFYHDLFGLDVILNQGEIVMLTEGLVLQEESAWRSLMKKEIATERNSCALYFEEREIEAFEKKLERLYPSILYLNRLTTDSRGRKMLRFYDLDGNLIEVGTPAKEI